MRSRLEEVGDEVIALVADGLSVRDACREADVPESTVRHWLKRGRREESGPYFEFARGVDDSRVFELPAGPLSEAELHEVVVRAARKGSVPAMSGGRA